eukprot:CAMPEP_0203785468 /NCGR_PEP_ID=MMETSP0100_2-20121128/1050_1 /ASSEMBLY_ACC=CAM_ASM_000210 /TAXON_ID=96639 /ORGANISM=" , Strain NY0313808BC1" /LENGTH=57 /DNA_ID=CAMNT_0050687587 /DNA_START=437 /DNA_END=610 /DNA_ORIENTATION=+
MISDKQLLTIGDLVLHGNETQQGTNSSIPPYPGAPWGRARANCGQFINQMIPARGYD